MDEKPKKGLPDNVRIYMTGAGLVMIESNTYGLFRDVLQDTTDPETGKVETVAIKKMVGPLGVFRPCEGDEQPDLRSFDPSSGRELKLKKLS